MSSNWIMYIAFPVLGTYILAQFCFEKYLSNKKYKSKPSSELTDSNNDKSLEFRINLNKSNKFK